MGAVSGTITGVTLLHGNGKGAGALKTYAVTVDTTADYTGSGDTLEIPLVGATIGTFVKNGKTNTLKAAHTIEPGTDTTGQVCYFDGASVAALAISTDSLTGEICDSTIANEVTAATPIKGVVLAVTVTES